MTREVALFKVYFEYEDDFGDYRNHTIQSSEFTELSEEDFQALTQYIYSQKDYGRREQLVLFEKQDIKDYRVHIDKVLEQAKEENKKRLERERIQKEVAEKRKAINAEKAAERKRKQLEKLKKELGVE